MRGQARPESPGNPTARAGRRRGAPQGTMACEATMNSRHTAHLRWSSRSSMPAGAPAGAPAAPRGGTRAAMGPGAASIASRLRLTPWRARGAARAPPRRGRHAAAGRLRPTALPPHAGERPGTRAGPVRCTAAKRHEHARPFWRWRRERLGAARCFSNAGQVRCGAGRVPGCAEGQGAGYSGTPGAPAWTPAGPPARPRSCGPRHRPATHARAQGAAQSCVAPGRERSRQPRAWPVTHTAHSLLGNSKCRRGCRMRSSACLRTS